jgi:hypothetical protein
MNKSRLTCADQIRPECHSSPPSNGPCAAKKKVIKQLEKIGRGFFWEGHAVANGGNFHVNWCTVCQPLSYGGLGIHDIERKGICSMPTLALAQQDG